VSTIAAALEVVGLQCSAVSSPILASVKVVEDALAAKVHNAVLFNLPCITLRENSNTSLRNKGVLAVDAVIPGNSLI